MRAKYVPISQIHIQKGYHNRDDKIIIQQPEIIEILGESSSSDDDESSGGIQHQTVHHTQVTAASPASRTLPIWKPPCCHACTTSASTISRWDRVSSLSTVE